GYIAEYLTAIGIDLAEVRVVPDRTEAIVEAVNVLRARNDYVFTTGGIGPTHDDITADAIAAAFGVGIKVDERAVAMLKQRYPEAELTPARLRMARLPDGAEPIANPVSLAPGFRIENVHVMAGVPRIMQAMLDEIVPTLQTGRRLLSATIEMVRPESMISDALRALQNDNADVMIGSYPGIDQRGFITKVVVRTADRDRLETVADEISAMIERVTGGAGTRLGDET
ncbi:MAG: competence/damage-inducible protein A, partial [Hyphomicrobiales bacterium]|nr:competence/damage-inducible protein A [Hyphomicrobiales bacterium]